MIKSCFILESEITDQRVFPLYQRLTIGRHSTNDIPLPDRKVSKRHAVVGRVKGQIVVKDLGSRNGTFVNGERVEKAVLANGDRVKVGSVVLRLFQAEKPVRSEVDQSSGTFKGLEKLVEFLTEAGIIDEFTLLRALDEEEKSQTIDKMLLDTGVLDDVNIAKALAKQLGIPLIRLQGKEIPEEVTTLVPLEIAKTHLLLPVKVFEGKLLVAMSDPLNSYAIQLLRIETKMKIEVAVAPREEILDAIAGTYPGEFLDQMLDGAAGDDEVTVEL